MEEADGLISYKSHLLLKNNKSSSFYFESRNILGFRLLYPNPILSQKNLTRTRPKPEVGFGILYRPQPEVGFGILYLTRPNFRARVWIILGLRRVCRRLFAIGRLKIFAPVSVFKMRSPTHSSQCYR